MLAGSKEEFGIEIQLVQTLDDWTYGRFAFWLDNHLVGDWSDESVDLNACMEWLRDFVEHSRDRYEPGLFTMNKDAAYRALCDGVIIQDSDADSKIERYDSTFSRFHISHLGMSSFEHVTLLLVEDEVGRQRCIWQQRSQEVQEAFLPPVCMQRIASECVTRFSPALGG